MTKQAIRPVDFEGLQGVSSRETPLPPDRGDGLQGSDDPEAPRVEKVSDRFRRGRAELLAGISNQEQVGEMRRKPAHAIKTTSHLLCGQESPQRLGPAPACSRSPAHSAALRWRVEVDRGLWAAQALRAERALQNGPVESVAIDGALEPDRWLRA